MGALSRLKVAGGLSFRGDFHCKNVQGKLECELRICIMHVRESRIVLVYMVLTI